MIEAKDQGPFRDRPLISYEREDGKISFLGPKRLSRNFVTTTRRCRLLESANHIET